MKCELVKVSDIKFQQKLNGAHGKSIYGIMQIDFIMNQHE